MGAAALTLSLSRTRERAQPFAVPHARNRGPAVSPGAAGRARFRGEMSTLALPEEKAAVPAQEPWSAWQVWGVILIAPYLLVFLAFVVYPVLYGFWLARHPVSYQHLFDDPIFGRAAVNTL